MRKPKKLSETQLRIMCNLARGKTPVGWDNRSLKVLNQAGLLTWPAGSSPTLSNDGEKLLFQYHPEYNNTHPAYPHTVPRPGDCDCKVCLNGYISVPDFDRGVYVWRRCSDERHLK